MGFGPAGANYQKKSDDMARVMKYAVHPSDDAMSHNTS